MFNKHYSRLNLSPEVFQELEKLEAETSLSNFRQLQLGKRVPLNTKSIGVSTSLENFDDSDESVNYSAKTVETSEPFFFPKERLIAKIAKDPFN